MSKSNRKRKQYTPKPTTNPEILKKKVDELRDNIEKIKKQRDMMYSALEKHVEYLSNFTSHDVKNAIQNMDSIVSSLNTDNVTKDEIDTIKTCLNSIRQSLDNFSSLVPNSAKKEFKLMELFKAAELINRSELKKRKIIYKLDINVV